MPEFQVIEAAEVPVAPLAAAGPPPGEDAAAETGADADARADGQDDAAAGLITEDFVEGVLRAAFDAVAASRGPHWSLSDQEAANIVPPLTRELQRVPFLRDVPVGSDLGLVVVHGAVILTTRLITDANLRRTAREWADADGATASAPAEPAGASGVQVVRRTDIYNGGGPA